MRLESTTAGNVGEDFETRRGVNKSSAVKVKHGTLQKKKKKWFIRKLERFVKIFPPQVCVGEVTEHGFW